jgi:hypothetical protein
MLTFCSSLELGFSEDASSDGKLGEIASSKELWGDSAGILCSALIVFVIPGTTAPVLSL